MLERVINGLRAFEKYVVRLPDEAVHRAISKPVEWVERKYGISRKRQALALSFTSCGTGEYLAEVAPLISHNMDLLRDTSALIETGLENEIVPYLKRRATRYISTWETMMKKAPIALSAALDIRYLLSRRESFQTNGAIANSDVYSYNSFTGVIRPYLLGGSIWAIFYGSDPTFVDYGVSLLPLAISMYARDSQSGGLLQRVLDRFRNSGPSTSSQPQAAQSSSPIAA